MTRDDLDPAARRLWLLVREQVGPSPAAAQDQRRLQAALAERRTKSQEFFSSSAGQWDRLRDELFGDRFHLAALAALRRARLDGRRSRLRHRPGERGARAVRRARHRGRRVGGDAAGARRSGCTAFDNVDLRRGELEALPIDDARLDAATLMLVLHHVPEPERALAEVARVLKPRRPRDRRRHAAARSRELPPADGPRLARLRDEHVRRMLQRQPGSTTFGSLPLPPDREGEGPGAVRRNRETNAGRRLGLSVDGEPSRPPRGESMATVTEKMHPFAAAKAAGREPFKVEGPRRSPSSAARKSASPSRRCPA